jgi:hypothetical protein
MLAFELKFAFESKSSTSRNEKGPGFAKKPGPNDLVQPSLCVGELESAFPTRGLGRQESESLRHE